MVMRDGVTYLRIGDVAKLIGKSPLTIKHWYEWLAVTPTSGKTLPQVFRDFGNRGTRYFREDDIEKFHDFIASMKYGEMSEFNAGLWGERGRLVLERRAGFRL